MHDRSLSKESLLIFGLLVVQGLLETAAERNGLRGVRRALPKEIHHNDEKKIEDKFNKDTRIPPGTKRNDEDRQTPAESRKEIIDELVKILYDEKERIIRGLTKRPAGDSAINKEKKDQLKIADHEMSNIPEELQQKGEEEEEEEKEGEDKKSLDSNHVSLDMLKIEQSQSDGYNPSGLQQRPENDEKVKTNGDFKAVFRTVYSDSTDARGPPGLWGREVRGCDTGLCSKDELRGPPGLWGKKKEEITAPETLRNQDSRRGPPGLWGKKDVEMVTSEELHKKQPKQPSFESQSIQAGDGGPALRWREIISEVKDILKEEKENLPHK